MTLNDILNAVKNENVKDVFVYDGNLDIPLQDGPFDEWIKDGKDLNAELVDLVWSYDKDRNLLTIEYI